MPSALAYTTMFIDGMATFATRSASPASFVTLPVIVTDSCAAATAGKSASAPAIDVELLDELDDLSFVPP